MCILLENGTIDEGSEELWSQKETTQKSVDGLTSVVAVESLETISAPNANKSAKLRKCSRSDKGKEKEVVTGKEKEFVTRKEKEVVTGKSSH
ncbi:hypothetical protein VNO78_23684 [Psophocarpus tetragonolobus]|uniref:Uncharacterized protein n=1 Tax=Psophocarpus tetragonolobus TaxID=3891 RepID=A0AAN9XE35_PSOTE